MYALGQKSSCGFKATQSAPAFGRPSKLSAAPRRKLKTRETPINGPDAPSSSTVTQAAREIAAAAPIAAAAVSTLPNGIAFAVSASCVYTAVVFLAVSA